jgi:chromosome segregation ATPase
LAEQVKEKEERVKNAEMHFNVELKKCREAQKKVADLASRLKKRNDEITQQNVRLDTRMAECDALERQLRHWQQELEEGATNASFSRGSDVGFSF